SSRRHGMYPLVAVLAGTDAPYDVVGGVADDIIEVLHRPAAPAHPFRVALDPREDRVFVQQLLVGFDLGAGQQATGIEMAGQLLVEPAHRQVPHIAIATRGDGDVGLVAGDRPELAPVAPLSRVFLPHLRREARALPDLRVGARSRA